MHDNWLIRCNSKGFYIFLVQFSQLQNDPMNRRGFVRKISLTLAAVAGALFGISFLKQFTARTGSTGKRRKVGYTADFPVDNYTYIDDLKIFVYRDHEAVRAVSAVCTHLGCTVQHTIDGFECPCHGSCYSPEGKVLSGPAPTALSWYKMEKAPDGALLVNLGETVAPGERYLIV